MQKTKKTARSKYRQDGFFVGTLPFSDGQLLFKQEGNRPEAAQSYNGVNDAADERRLSPKNRGDQVNTEKSDAAPVKSADNHKDQCCIIQFIHSSQR